MGRIRVVDHDVVTLTDLHRQILFTQSDAERQRPKAQVAAERLGEANPETEVDPRVVEFNPRTAESLIGDADLVVDCSDNLKTRMLINEVCAKHSKGWIHGACVSTAGMVIPFPPNAVACYRCVVDHIPEHPAVPTCEEAGILGAVAGMIGCIEAAEAIKMLVVPESQKQRIIYIESFTQTYETIEVRKRRDCPVCVRGVYEFLDGGRGS